MSKTRDLRDVEREYRRRRAAVLDDEGLSWEKKMLRTKELFAQYRKRQEDLEDEQGAA